MITTLEIDGVQRNTAATPHRSGSSKSHTPELPWVGVRGSREALIEIPDTTRESAGFQQQNIESAAVELTGERDARRSSPDYAETSLIQTARRPFMAVFQDHFRVQVFRQCPA
jgi:hypothetical protein